MSSEIPQVRSAAGWATPNYAVESAERKAAPLWSGVMRYFPNALLAVARLSKKANDKHNPGEPLHWSEHKSNDHGDCIARHQLNPEEIDAEMGEPHAVMVAWRALAQLEIIERKRKTMKSPCNYCAAGCKPCPEHYRQHRDDTPDDRYMA